MGLEPTTSTLRVRRATHCATPPLKRNDETNHRSVCLCMQCFVNKFDKLRCIFNYVSRVSLTLTVFLILKHYTIYYTWHLYFLICIQIIETWRSARKGIADNSGIHQCKYGTLLYKHALSITSLTIVKDDTNRWKRTYVNVCSPVYLYESIVK